MPFYSDFRRQSAGVLLLRFTVSGLMLFHGVAKLRNGLGPIESILSEAGLPTWFAYGVFLGEIVAPLLVLVGVWVRAAALIMAVNMVFAIGLAHSPDLLALGRSGGYALESQAFFLLCSIAVALLAGRKGS